MKSFLVMDDGTINLHYDGLSPRDVQALIQKLEGNLQVLKMKPADPIVVMKKSARIDRIHNELTFCLNWNSPVMTINLDAPTIPEPNVELNEEQYEKYITTLNAMLK